VKSVASVGGIRPRRRARRSLVGALRAGVAMSGRARHRALRAGQVDATGGARCTSCPPTRRRSARARRGRRPIALPPTAWSATRRLGDGAARGDRRGLRPQSRAHRLRRRLRRDPEPDRARLYRPGRRGDLHRARLPRLPIAILAAGGTPVVAPETDLTADVDAILARVTSARSRLPRQSQQPDRHLPAVRGGAPPARRPAANVLLVLDAAYAEYVRRNDYESGHRARRHAPNVVMTRTFSKIYGLAGLGSAGATGRRMSSTRSTASAARSTSTAPAIAAGVAALATAPISRRPSPTTSAGCRLTDAIGKLGLKVTPSVGNFILIHFPDAGRQAAADADAFLLEARHPAPGGWPTACRTRCA
jgi:hypothetical protein